MMRPDFTPPEAEALARDRYGIHARATELPSERDRNFLLRVTGDGRGAGRQPSEGAKDAGAERAGDAFVLKIGNPDESRASLEMQNAILAALAKRWLEDDDALRSPFPAVVLDLAGDPLAFVEKEGVLYPLRLVTWPARGAGCPGAPAAAGAVALLGGGAGPPGCRARRLRASGGRARLPLGPAHHGDLLRQAGGQRQREGPARDASPADGGL